MPHFYSAPPIPRAFIWKKAHSLSGIWLLLFLIEHLLTNSRAALFFSQQNMGFVSTVNAIKDLPYLPLIEIFLLGVPLIIHAVLGFLALKKSSYNSFKSDESKPSFPEFKENRRYTWQRVTAWILLVGIGAHVGQMRFLDAPYEIQDNRGAALYVTEVAEDQKWPAMTDRLGVQVYTKERIAQETQAELARALAALPLKNNHQFILTPSFGVAELFLVKETLSSPSLALLYTGLVLAAAFHACNGLWSVMINLGITLTERSQKAMHGFALLLTTLLSSLGLFAIWGTYLFP